MVAEAPEAENTVIVQSSDWVVSKQKLLIENENKITVCQLFEENYLNPLMEEYIKYSGTLPGCKEYAYLKNSFVVYNACEGDICTVIKPFGPFAVGQTFDHVEIGTDFMVSFFLEGQEEPHEYKHQLKISVSF